MWFFPAVETVALALLAVVMIQIDWALYDAGELGDRNDVFRGGVDGARGVLTAIAGSLIAAAATVFSITVVVLQLASSQFTPRVLPSFISDRRFQSTVGTLLGTFVYCLLTLWSVGQERENQQAFIPILTIAVAILLALVSVALLILFIHHVSTLIQVSSLVDRVTNETIHMINRYGAGRPDDDLPQALTALDPDGVVVVSDKAGYLRSVNVRALVEAAAERQAAIEFACPIGTYVLPGLPIARVSPATVVDDELLQAVRGACALASERVAGSDIEFSIKRVADIALKALSPGINDPTTAINAIDRLAEIMVAFAGVSNGPTVETGEDGGIVVLPPSPASDVLVQEVFAQLRHYGAADVLISKHLATQLGRIAMAAPGEMAQALRQEAALIPVNCEQAGMIGADLQVVQHAAAWAREEPEPESSAPQSADRKL